MRILSILLLISLFLCNLNFNAYAYSNLLFKNITIEDGLSQPSVQSIIQDKRGYIWIGTSDGLNRYNGYDFKVYRSENKSTNTLKSSYILNIQEDREGNIWAATTQNISKIEVDSDTIINYDLKGGIVTDGILTSNGQLIFSTTEGIYIYNKDSDKFEKLLSEGEELSSDYIYAIEEDKNGNLWVAVKRGIRIINLENKEVKKLFENDDSIDNTVYDFYFDKDDYMWMCTMSFGLFRIKISTNEVYNYVNEEGNDKSIPSNFITEIYRDSRDMLWVCTDKGLAKFNEDDDTFGRYQNKMNDKYSIISNDIYTIAEDRTGLLWVGTNSGISIFDPVSNIKCYRKDFLDENSISENSIHGIYEDNNGYIWLGTNSSGVDIIDINSDELLKFNISKLNYKLSNDSINDIAGKDDTVAIATNNGLNIINKNKKEIRKYYKEDGLSGNNIRNLLIDSKGYLWIGTSEGFNIINLKNNEIIDITFILSKYFESDTFSGAIYEDSDGVYWIGSLLNGGLVKIDPINKIIKSYKYSANDNSISNNSIRVITEDKDKNLWIGTSMGLNKFNKEGEFFVNYTTLDGLANNTVYGILIDDNNNIWVSTNCGVSMLESDSERFFNLNITDGLQSNEFNSESYYKTKNGEMLFGGINGLNIFDPDEVFNDKDIPEVMFEEFKVNGVEIQTIKNKIFKDKENTISIRVFLPDYKNINNIQYYYTLNKSNNKWNVMKGNEVTLSNLSPGKYTFKVKARNRLGEFTKEKSINFVIKPPIWKSNVAIIFYILLIGFIVYKNRTKVRKLDYMVYKRTRELNEEMKKNEELFKKVLNLEKRKNNYLVNISHELRTPLNVLYSSQQLISQLNKDGNGISKDKLDYYMDIFRRNTERLLKIINDLIDTSKIDHGNYNLHIEKNDIVYLVEEAALSLKDFIESKGISLIIDPEVEEFIIDCDSMEIERCIINLVSNAAKFTESGGQILISIKELKNCVKIEVKDTGIGIEEKYLESIFDRFNQVVDETREIKGGSGLGLTITKNIINLHNGRIYAESKVNEGSNFIIILPISLDDIDNKNKY